MKVAVLGLWHLGSVTAACLARAGHEVTGWDPDRVILAGLRDGRAPIAEPGLDALIAGELASGALRFTAELPEAVRDGDVVWVAFDTPVDDEDRADIELVMERVREALPHVGDGALVISSSQLPVGSVARMERDHAALSTGRRVGFASVPENLRLGQALDVFNRPDRVVAGVRTEHDRAVVGELFAPITDRIVWMSVESAEMTKHAINAFLATSVTFINEIASICEAVGADAKDVERGLKSDRRIGAGAYLSPGAAFSGGTLARDLAVLGETAAGRRLHAPLLRGVQDSNREHASWSERTLASMLASPGGRRVAVWGLTYKPGTDTLRRSMSVELCVALARDGARITAFDPAVRELPETLRGALSLAPDPIAAAAGADAVVVATHWPMLKEVSADALLNVVAQPIVIDAGRFLAGTLGADPRIRYAAVGTPRS